MIDHDDDFRRLLPLYRRNGSDEIIPTLVSVGTDDNRHRWCTLSFLLHRLPLPVFGPCRHYRPKKREALCAGQRSVCSVARSQVGIGHGGNGKIRRG